MLYAGRVPPKYTASRTFPFRAFTLPSPITAFLSCPTPAVSMFINAFYLCVFLAKCTGLTAIFTTCLISCYVRSTYLAERTVTSRHAVTKGVPRTSVTADTASLLLYHCQNVVLPVTSATPNCTFAILFYQSSRRHRRHPPTLRQGFALLRPSSSNIYTQGGTLTPRHLALPTTSQLPQAIPLSHLATSEKNFAFNFSTTSGLPQTLTLWTLINKYSPP